MSDINNEIMNSNFIQEALYDKFKKDFANEIKDGLLNRKELWIGDIGYLTAKIMKQGIKSGEVIDNVKLKFVPSKEFKKEINKALLDK